MAKLSSPITVLVLALAMLACKNNPSESHVEEIIVVCKTHFDIGYTHRVDELIEYYRTEMIDRALDNLEQSKALPEEQQFTWTGPGWVMARVSEDWAGQSPDRMLRIEEAFHSGRFVTHALPFTFETDVCAPELLARSFQASSSVTRSFGLPLSRDAKMTDVPSHSNLMATALAQAGVKFMHMGCNWPSGSVQYPPLFWWEGPDGSRVLTMYSSIYGTCTVGWSKNWGKSQGIDHPGTIGMNLMPPENWPHKAWLAIIVTPDNSGPPKAEDLQPLFKEVKEKYPNISIRMGRMEDFANIIIDSKPDLPVVKAEAPDTWIHGVMCDPGGQQLARSLQYLLPAAEQLNTQLQLWNLPVHDAATEINQAFENCMLYDEHTWGGASSVRSYGKAFHELPDSTFKQLEDSWTDKTNYIRQANQKTEQVLQLNLETLAAEVNLKTPGILVYNPLPWSRSGRIELPGKPGQFLQVKDVPASGYTSIPYPVEAAPISQTKTNSLENEYLSIRFDLNRGIIASLIDKRTGKEWIDPSAELGLGQYMNERFTAEQALEYTLAYQQGRAKGSFGNPDEVDWPHPGINKPGMISADEVPYRKASPEGGTLKIWRDKAGQTALISMPGDSENHLPETALSVRLDDGQDHIDLEIFIKNKARDNWPEADWLCLPFNIKDPKFSVGRQLGFMDPADILPGANRHLYSTGSGVSMTATDGSGVFICPIDHSLISLGQPGCWKFSHDYLPDQAIAYLNLYNNQWNTNFRYWYPGSWSSRVRIWINENQETQQAKQVTASMEARNPLIAVAVNGQAGSLPTQKTGISIDRQGIAVTAFGKDFNGNPGILLRVWEHAGQSGRVTISFPEETIVTKALPINFRGEKLGKALKIRNNHLSFELGAFAPASFMLQ